MKGASMEEPLLYDYDLYFDGKVPQQQGEDE